MIPLTKLTGRLGNQMFQHAYIYARMRDGIIPDVYVQNPSYFEKYADEIKLLYGQNITPINQVAIHVRRGDYVNNPFYVDLTNTMYYDEAIKLFPEGTNFLVFSDDQEYAKDMFTGEQYEFSEGRNEIDDFNLMSGCEGHIIANSSYSYWAAYVSPYTKKVVCPDYDKWYSDGSKTRTVTPNHWVHI